MKTFLMQHLTSGFHFLLGKNSAEADGLTEGKEAFEQKTVKLGGIDEVLSKKVGDTITRDNINPAFKLVVNYASYRTFNTIIFNTHFIFPITVFTRVSSASRIGKL